MLLPRLLTSCRNSSNHFSTLPTTSHLLSTLLNDLHLSAHFLDSPQLSFHLSLLFSTPFNSRCLTSPQFHLSNIFSQPGWSDTVQTFFFSPVELPLHSIDPFESLKLHSAYLKSWCQRMPSSALKHANMSVSSTAAGSPMNNWQPDHVYAGSEQTCHLNMPTWAWAAQLHTPRWIVSAPKCMKVCCLILICSLHAVTPIRFTHFSCKRHYCSIS